MSDEPPERRASHRGRRWLIVGAVLLVVVIAARLAAPTVIAGRIEARRGEALGAPVRVDVDLRLWAGEAPVHGLRVAPAQVTSASSASVGALHLRWLARPAAWQHAATPRGAEQAPRRAAQGAPRGEPMTRAPGTRFDA